MRNYELIIITKSDDAIVEKTKERVKEILSEFKGVIDRENPMGKRKLAYEIKKNKDGYYYLAYVQLDPSAVDKIKKLFLIEENILKHMFVKID
jgi:small subunit ribosomal protein S6